MRIRGQRHFSHRQRFGQHPFRTLAGLHSFRYEHSKTDVELSTQGFSTEQF
jgi:hypothetical protein